MASAQLDPWLPDETSVVDIQTGNSRVKCRVVGGLPTGKAFLESTAEKYFLTAAAKTSDLSSTIDEFEQHAETHVFTRFASESRPVNTQQYFEPYRVTYSLLQTRIRA